MIGLDGFTDIASEKSVIMSPSVVNVDFAPDEEDGRDKPRPELSNTCSRASCPTTVIPRETFRSLLLALTISWRAPTVVSASSRSSFRNCICSDTLILRSSLRFSAMSCWTSTVSCETSKPAPRDEA